MRVNSNCIECKGRYPKKHCGRNICPITLNNQATAKVRDMNMSNDFSADSPSIFVGRFGYPNVNVGFLTPPEKKEDTWLYDAPRTWANKDFNIPQVVDYRSALINSRFKADVKQGRDSPKFVEMAQEVSQASKPVELEVNLEKKPKFQTNFDHYLAPTGPNALLDKVNITSNPFIDQQVDKRVSDTDLLAKEAIIGLVDKGFDENFLSRLLSMGNIGIGKNRKLVPTRWSITAVDDMVGKDILNQIRDYEVIQPTLFFGGYMGNYYIILMFEDVWQYELFEMYASKNRKIPDYEMEYTTDYEGYEGRIDYAQRTAGGYYAARLPVLNFLKKEKKQSACLVFRFITEEYTCPLGVWVCREAVRKALEGKRHFFESKEQLIGYAKFIAKKRFNYNLDILLKESNIYDNLTKQMKLSMFVR